MWWIGVAQAWEVNTVDWVYQEARIEEAFSLNVASFADVAEPAEIEALFQASIDTWNVESDADLYVVYGGPTQVDDQGGGDDGTNTSVYGSLDFGGGLAVATIGFSGQRLNDCDIAFHRRNLYGVITWHVGEEAAPAGSFDLANTMVHEIGHCLGMNHSDRAGAIMYAFNDDGTGDEARHLSDDDRGGIQFLYGEVAPELVADGASLVGDAVHGEDVAIELTVRNLGDGTAWRVEATPAGPVVVLGDIGSPTPVGARVGPDVATFPVVLPVDCAADALEVEAVLTDARARSWALTWSIPIDCAIPSDPEPDPAAPEAEGPAAGGEAAGCGCASAAPPARGLLSAVFLLVRRRASR